ncbi:MAG TPA: alginate lyase family protein [Candidatus Hydrogenedentes bacterium]|nr:alginate lyase family protein [Candidatus Hydrogenedentota bacterium]HPU96722.1 alginate lyase family protein [Candidatus Hydrogenedentota bacterium]
MRRVLQYWHTLRHLHPAQVAWRLVRPLRMRIPLPKASRAEWDVTVLHRLRRFMEEAVQAGLDSDASVLLWLEGNLALAGCRIQTESPERLPWHSRKLSRLALFQLHGFRYVRWLAAAGIRGGITADQARTLLTAAAQDWIDRNPPLSDPGWDPYPIAERLFNWILAIAALEADSEPVRLSAALQALHLSRTLEYDLQGNHLIREWAALSLARTALNDPQGAAKALNGLRKAVEQQLLPSGEHHERSWMYHNQILFDLLALRAALPEVPSWLDLSVSRMAAALENALHEDMEIPLFNDAVFGETPGSRVLLDLAGKSGSDPGNGKTIFCRNALVPFGTSRISTAAGTLLIKGGPVGVDHQMGHAHADPGIWELSRDGLRWVVDAGMHGYGGSALRDACRSAPAHNTVVINHEEPLEFWGTFRVARRCRFEEGRVLEGRPGEQGVELRYRWFQGWVHTRVFRIDAEGSVWLEDTVEGTGPLHAASLVHFHPLVKAVAEENGRVLRLFQNGIAGPALRVESGNGWEPAPGIAPTANTLDADEIPLLSEPGGFYYCPRFGVALPGSACQVSGSGNGVVRLAIRILPPSAG